MVEGFQPSPPGFRTSVYQQSMSQDWPVSRLRWPPGSTPTDPEPALLWLVSCFCSRTPHTSLLLFTATRPLLPSRARTQVPAALIRPFHKLPCAKHEKAHQADQSPIDPGAGEQAWPITSWVQRREEDTSADPVSHLDQAKAISPSRMQATGGLEPARASPLRGDQGG